MVKHIYTLTKWYTSAAILIYKPNITDPTIQTDYMPIDLMNYILKLRTSILASIGIHTANTENLFSNNMDGFRAHEKCTSVSHYAHHDV